MSRLLCLVLLALLSLAPAHASDSKSCTSQGLEFLTLSAGELAAVAADCEDSELRSLFRRRARHQQIVSSFRILARLQMGHQARHGTDPDAVRLHMALVEVMAPIWFPNDAKRVDFLNAQYQHRIRVADLRLRGHDLAAARLEREFTSRD